LAESLN